MRLVVLVLCALVVALVDVARASDETFVEEVLVERLNDGVAALVFSVNPEMNAWEVKELLERTAVDLGPKGRDTQYGTGLLDALAAVREAKKN